MTTNLRSIVPHVAVAGGAAALLAFVMFGQAGDRAGRVRVAQPMKAAEATRIEIDNNSHKIRFFVDGKQVSVLDGLGMHGEVASAE